MSLIFAFRTGPLQRCNSHATMCYKGLLLLWGALGIIGGAVAAPVPVYLRASPTQWQSLPASEQQGRVVIAVPASRLGRGEITLVVNKPAWMNLEDNEPPKLAWLKLNEKERQADKDDWGVISQFPLKVALGLKDNANPLNPDNVQAYLDGQLLAPSDLLTNELGPPRTSGRLSLTIPSASPGAHELRVKIADLSPQNNSQELVFRFRVIGFEIAPDQQTIRIGSPAGTYIFRAKRLGELQVGDITPAYLSTGMKGGYFYIEKIERIEMLSDTADVKSLRIHAVPGKTDKNEEGAQYARLQYDLTVRADVPCLLVTSRTINVAEKQEIYSWWGWLPGIHFQDPRGVHEWAGQYQDVGFVGWIFLPQEGTNTPGLGWISPHFFGESRFNTMLLYTEPRRMMTEKNGAVEIKFGIMPAQKAEEVAAAAAKIKDLGLW